MIFKKNKKFNLSTCSCKTYAQMMRDAVNPYIAVFDQFFKCSLNFPDFLSHQDNLIVFRILFPYILNEIFEIFADSFNDVTINS